MLTEWISDEIANTADVPLYTQTMFGLWAGRICVDVKKDDGTQSQKDSPLAHV
jgi:hypothetical protein